MIMQDIHQGKNNFLIDIKEGGNQMVDYRIVKFCRGCSKRFVVNKGESKRYFCDECEKKHNQQ